jgi:hypothetical protein
MIEAKDYRLTSYYMLSNGLNITGTDSTTGKYQGIVIPAPDIPLSNAQFVVSQNGTSTDITWNASTPIVGGPPPPHPIIHFPPHPPGPPGHVLI